jgi:hypothetical protein
MSVTDNINPMNKCTSVTQMSVCHSSVKVEFKLESSTAKGVKSLMEWITTS